ncbi:WD repeat-containing protein 70 [Pyrus ussuriensis x Pyrus communis]|uniref:WD repeat-containing protein 70 n=1 Tax=Pyrus ussuriensis x Pyrus communis TaxID=2448454 RepID=A0A5N5I8I2_9ROSA|nr:WD repeat-containing protein 70 [Pyrus ussuriensis x Pyrus communis]
MAVEPGRISLRRKTPEKQEEEEEEKEKCSEEIQRQSPVADDEAEIYDGIRAAFPLSFGKQSKSQTSLEAIHNTTRRSVTNKPPEKPSSDAVKTNGLPSLSPSSQTWLSSLRAPKNLNPDPNSNENDDGDAMVGPPPPRPQSDLGDDNDDERDKIGPPRPPAGSSRDDSDSDSDSEANFENRFRIPLSNEIVLKGHTKVVSALAVDHTGSRVVSGSYDYSVRMYDFQGMSSKLQSFRQLEPSEGHQVRTISWSPTAYRFLCVTGSATAKIYDRDGLTLGEFVKGDMYIRDLKNTKGHISGLTCGEWNPKSKDTILTSSEDGSLRIWDVIKPKLARPGRVPVTTCAWDHDGKRIAGGIGDGSMQVLDGISYFNNHSSELAHKWKFSLVG